MNKQNSNRHIDIENKLIAAKGERGERGLNRIKKVPHPDKKNGLVTNLIQQLGR